MRVVALGVLGLGLLPGGACASSILTLGDTPASTPSIVMLGEEIPAVTYETVSVVPHNAGPVFSPMVIRGGIVGNASTAAATPAATDKAAKPKTLQDAITEASGQAPAKPAPQS